ncbi:hypothetical protein GIB67_003899 [Kingdonia uniflora]|uniref:Uncharacterized protein n=1 Tax=Kingdonia uniflora TaxID=39325 RepID=A0A7J7LJZ2_9MAGN|nr:hypothetical protein GIB67_003899 [Kingdonia uniflora]
MLIPISALLRHQAKASLHSLSHFSTLVPTEVVPKAAKLACGSDQPGTPSARPYEAPTPSSDWSKTHGGNYSEPGTPQLNRPAYANAQSPYVSSSPGIQPITPGSACYLPGTPGVQPMTLEGVMSSVIGTRIVVAYQSKVSPLSDFTTKCSFWTGSCCIIELTKNFPLRSSSVVAYFTNYGFVFSFRCFSGFGGGGCVVAMGARGWVGGGVLLLLLLYVVVWCVIREGSEDVTLAREGIKSIWEDADFIKVSDDEVAFLAHGDANDENNVLSLWYDGLKLFVVTDGNKGCRYFTKGIEHLQHALEISPENVVAYFGLASRLLVNPVGGSGRDLDELQTEINVNCKRINKMFGYTGYEPIVYIDKPLSISERIAFYSIAECVVVSAVRDDMNLTPYEYIVCRQGVSGLGSGLDSSGIKKSMLVVSKFVGCFPSLSGAIRINLWNIETIGEALNEEISMAESEKQLLHEKHYRYVSTHDVAYWSQSFMQDLERSCKDHFRRRCYAMGIGFGFRLVALDANFKKLEISTIESAYKKSRNKAIFERGRDNLSKWFSPCEEIGIVTEHGYYMRWSQDKEWESCGQNFDFGWIQMAEPVMKLYIKATDGSSIETKESGLVWHHQDANPGIGSCQAKEMLDHLESVLANEVVTVKRGQFIIKVKPQGVSKGIVVDKVFTSIANDERKADFVLCIGGNRLDEEMFKIIENAMSRIALPQC